jgi:hypothetical protein
MLFNLVIAEPLATSKAPKRVILEPEVTSKAPKRVMLEPVTVSILPNLEFALPVYVKIEELNVLNEPVGTNCSLPNPFRKEAFAAYEAEAIEPEIVMLPEVMMLPVTVSEPEMYGELSIILLCYS